MFEPSGLANDAFKANNNARKYWQEVRKLLFDSNVVLLPHDRELEHFLGLQNIFVYSLRRNCLAHLQELYLRNLRDSSPRWPGSKQAMFRRWVHAVLEFGDKLGGKSGQDKTVKAETDELLDDACKAARRHFYGDGSDGSGNVDTYIGRMKDLEKKRPPKRTQDEVDPQNQDSPKRSRVEGGPQDQDPQKRSRNGPIADSSNRMDESDDRPLPNVGVSEYRTNNNTKHGNDGRQEDGNGRSWVAILVKFFRPTFGQ